MAEPIRILHHWACSGGTILSRAIASQPGAVFLSEIHPHAYLRSASPRHHYLPTDLLQQLSLTRNGADPTLLNATFRGAIISLQQELETSGRHLVIRSHSHSEFFVGEPLTTKPLISELLAPHWPLRQLLTVRHPLDSWLSLLQSAWLEQQTYRELGPYCERILIMLEACKAMPWIRYEEFCGQPEALLQQICDLLMLPFDPMVLEKERLLQVKISGNSGRSANIIKITPRRQVPEAVASEATVAEPYRQVCERLGYNPNPECAWPFLA